MTIRLLCSRIGKSVITAGILYHSFHFVLPSQYKHNLVLDIDHTTGFTAFTEPNDHTLQQTVQNFGNQYTHMVFTEINPRTKEKIQDQYFFFPRRHLWIIGLFQKIGFFNIHFFSDATSDYVEHVMALYQQVGITPTFPFVARENNPDYKIHKKDLLFLKQRILQQQRIDLQGSFTLVDDKSNRQVLGQSFYHIPPIKGNQNDNELLKMLFVVYGKCVVHDIHKLCSFFYL
jgi:hypothetical protein